MSAVKAVIFDLDGCLVDSEPLCLDAIASEMRRLGIADATTDEIRRRFLGVSMQVICAHVTERLGADCPEDFVVRVEDRLEALYVDQLRLIDGARELLDRLKANDIAMAIATGGSIRRMTFTLETMGLMPYFAGNACSAEQVERGKPFPDLFQFAARKLNVNSAECVVLEDSPHGVTGAVQAGMKAVGFLGGTHLDGIREPHRETLEKAGVETVVGDLSTFWSYLEPAVARA